MEIKFIDHIVLVTKNIRETEKFYSSFLGRPEYLAAETVVYKIGETKVFFVLPDGEFEKVNKDSLNHLAFGVRNLEELRDFESFLNGASITHSGIKTDHYGNKEFIWFDDPCGLRLECYCRPL